MADIIEQHQVAGLDERERGFNRQMNVEQVGDRVRAVLRYEKTLVETRPCGSTAEALEELIRMLRERGYRQLRSRLNFRAGAYLGSREAWIEYSDPDEPSEPVVAPVTEQLARRTGWIGKVLRLFSSS
ncbi:hypothetical protein [Candidatus Nitrospira bockiana]